MMGASASHNWNAFIDTVRPYLRREDQRAFRLALPTPDKFPISPEHRYFPDVGRQFSSFFRHGLPELAEERMYPTDTERVFVTVCSETHDPYVAFVGPAATTPQEIPVDKVLSALGLHSFTGGKVICSVDAKFLIWLDYSSCADVTRYVITDPAGTPVGGESSCNEWPGHVTLYQGADSSFICRRSGRRQADGSIEEGYTLEEYTAVNRQSGELELTGVLGERWRGVDGVCADSASGSIYVYGEEYLGSFGRGWELYCFPRSSPAVMQIAGFVVKAWEIHALPRQRSEYVSSMTAFQGTVAFTMREGSRQGLHVYWEVPQVADPKVICEYNFVDYTMLDKSDWHRGVTICSVVRAGAVACIVTANGDSTPCLRIHHQGAPKHWYQRTFFGGDTSYSDTGPPLAILKNEVQTVMLPLDLQRGGHARILEICRHTVEHNKKVGVISRRDGIAVLVCDDNSTTTSQLKVAEF